MPYQITLPFAACICGDPSCIIPFGLCHCGCGKMTSIIARTQNKRGLKKGYPYKYASGHGRFKERYLLHEGVCICGNKDCEIPFGLCHCGCGEKTNIARTSSRYHGCIDGMPRKFAFGHYFRGEQEREKIKEKNRTRFRNLADSSHEYKGVRLTKIISKPWVARIEYDGERHDIGPFESEYEAACAYDEAAIKHHGWTAVINLPDRHPEFIAKEKEIVQRLLCMEATFNSIAEEEGCVPYRIKVIYLKHTTKEQRREIMAQKIGKASTGRKNPKLAEWNRKNKPQLGRQFTQESLQKMSYSRKGKKQTIERRIRHSARLQGIPVSEWEGFASDLTKQVTKSIEYQAWRKAVYERDDWTCQHCKKRGPRLHAHHIKPKSRYPELMFDVSNGLTLCEPCHHKIHTKMEEARHGIFIRRGPQKSLINSGRGEKNELTRVLLNNEQAQREKGTNSLCGWSSQ